MKAITIWQPWADLIAHGHKKIETRSWYTPYRGKIAIHAAKKPLRQVSPLPSEMYNFFDKDNLIFGVVIATASLVNCVKITKEYRESKTDKEVFLGDYRLGRYAWELENVELIEPVYIAGKQRLWNWED